MHYVKLTHQKREIIIKPEGKRALWKTQTPHHRWRGLQPRPSTMSKSLWVLR